MLVTGSHHSHHFERAPASRQAAGGQPQAAPRDDAREAAGRPAHFSMISTISPGSLAAAYQALRARQVGDDAGAMAAMPARDPAILSGLGIPAALDAYGEVLDAD
ncbi:MAG: hypothetical protein DCC69_07685 [Hyphomicrobiales bacterium]|nr:MAG: hypothetical protein DCC69_07685 [Hyphomicrobiales bacterium]